MECPSEIKYRVWRRHALRLFRHRMGEEASRRDVEAALSAALNHRSVVDFSFEEFGRQLNYTLADSRGSGLGQRIFITDVSAEWKVEDRRQRKRNADRERQRRRRTRRNVPRLSDRGRALASFLDRPLTCSELGRLLETHPAFLGEHGEIVPAATLRKRVQRAADELVKLGLATSAHMAPKRGIAERQLNPVMRRKSVI